MIALTVLIFKRCSQGGALSSRVVDTGRLRHQLAGRLGSQSVRTYVTAIPVHFVDYFDIPRNFALDSLVSPTLHLAQSVLLFRAHLDISDRASNQLDFLGVIDSLIHEGVPVAGAQAFGLSFLARLELDPSDVIVH